MTSRERVRKAINHEEPDKVPHDLGATPVTGIAASSYAKLRQRLGFGEGKVKVYEPFQMLGDVEPEAREALGIDVIGLRLPSTFFGFRNDEGWKPWRLFDGTEVLVPEKFTTTEDEYGNILIYPEGDLSAPPSGKMPKGGFYFDAIVRQQPIDEENLDPDEWVEGMYAPLTDEQLRHLEETCNYLYNNTTLSIVGTFIDSSFGDIAWVPAPHIKHPKGIRDPKEWYIAQITHPEYIKGIFERQCEIALKNLEMAYEAVGDKIDVIMVSGTDFGTQNGPFISPDMYRELYKPFHKRINDWIHTHTSWKTFFHSCGSIVEFLDDFAEAGVDIINPVQCSAAGMSPEYLKENYGDVFTFWGGGVDTQKTLPFGTPEQVEEEVRTRLEVFRKGGGFVFAAIHNIQARVPVENLEAMYRALARWR